MPKYIRTHPPKNDLTKATEPFGRLTVKEWLGKKPGDDHFYRCVCSCGTEVEVRGKNLSRHLSQSCGCLRADLLSEKRWKGYGGLSGSYWYAVKKDAAKRGHLFEVSIQYVWELFLQQKGRCSFTGLELTTDGEYGRGTASLDRLDSKIGYVEGNVHWVHRDVNLMKNSLPLDRFLELCYLIANHEG